MDDISFLLGVTPWCVCLIYIILFPILDYLHSFLFQGMCGSVMGHWVVDFNEATCVTWWRGYDDKVLFTTHLLVFPCANSYTIGLRRTRNPCSFSCHQSLYLNFILFCSAMNPSWITSKTATIGTKCALPLLDMSKAGISMGQQAAQLG
jgi:hypothetical protein